MYYPKSYITPNLYSNGEFLLAGSNTIYTGYYFKVLTGKTYTGRYPNDGEQLELIPLQSNNSEESTEADFITDLRFDSPNFTYSTINKISPTTTPTISVRPFYPSPTQQDYKLGEFTRYFSKKVNEDLYVETEVLTKNVLYIGFSLPWSITGDKDSTYNLNKRIVELKEEQLNINGLGAFLKFNYIQYYK
jgi:hypothetical protein